MPSSFLGEQGTIWWCWHTLKRCFGGISCHVRQTDDTQCLLMRRLCLSRPLVSGAVYPQLLLSGPGPAMAWWGAHPLCHFWEQVPFLFRSFCLCPYPQSRKLKNQWLRGYLIVKLGCCRQEGVIITNTLLSCFPFAGHMFYFGVCFLSTHPCLSEQGAI